MTWTFNLVDEPFIPCAFADGAPRPVGLKEALLRAHQVREVRDDSPVVTVTLHRLLLAILHRNLGPPNLKAWQRLWEAGCFDPRTIEPYLEHWRGRFDLFDAERPFYQTGGMTTENPLPVAALFEELACNNNPTLFDHTTNEASKGISSAAAARGLIARQAFALGLGISPQVTINGRTFKTGHRKDAPLARGLLLLMRGETLFHTLMCNLSVYTPSDDDLPTWEQEDLEALIPQRRALGRLDLYTCQSRRLRLIPPDSDASWPLVTRVHFAQGRDIDKEEIDPMKPYRRDETRGWSVFSIDPRRALWRDSAALFELARDPERPVPALNWMARAVADGIVSRHRAYTLDVFGVGTDAGRATSVILWRHDHLPLPAEYLDSPELVGVLREAISIAEKVAGALWQSVHPAAGENADDDPEILEMVWKLSPERLYWSRLEVPFRRLLVDLPDGSQTPEFRLAGWVCHILCREAEAAFEDTVGQLDRSARLLKAVATARARLKKQLQLILNPHKELLHEQG